MDLHQREVSSIYQNSKICNKVWDDETLNLLQIATFSNAVSKCFN